MTIKTLRDDFALTFLHAQIQLDLMKQTQGAQPGDVGPMMIQAYQAADACLGLREQLTVEALKFGVPILRPS